MMKIKETCVLDRLESTEKYEEAFIMARKIGRIKELEKIEKKVEEDTIEFLVKTKEYMESLENPPAFLAYLKSDESLRLEGEKAVAELRLYQESEIKKKIKAIEDELVYVKRIDNKKQYEEVNKLFQDSLYQLNKKLKEAEEQRKKDEKVRDLRDAGEALSQLEKKIEEIKKKTLSA